MKKIIFATQIFALVAIFPLYLVMELNQVKSQVSFNNVPAVMIDKQEDNTNQSGFRVKNDNAMLVIDNTLLVD